MKRIHTSILVLSCLLTLIISVGWILPDRKDEDEIRAAFKGETGHYLYVATPGIRDYLGYGGHGLLVFDIDNNHKFVKRISTKGFHPDGRPSNVKGIAVSAQLNSIYLSTIESLQRIDLGTEQVLWEIPFEGGCDRMSISPDGMTMYLPSFEKDFWNVVDCKTGKIITKIKIHSRAHNTIYSQKGDRAYMADIGSPLVYVADTKTHTVSKTVDLSLHQFGPLPSTVKSRLFLST